jgi:hypothetical protein
LYAGLKNVYEYNSIFILSFPKRLEFTKFGKQYNGTRGENNDRRNASTDVKASCTDWCNNCSNSWCTKLVKDSTNVTVLAPVYKADEVARESVSTGGSNIASNLLMSLINDQHICNDTCI